MRNRCGTARLDYRTKELLEDHRVQDRVIFPAAGYIEMALEAGAQMTESTQCDLVGVEFFKAYVLPSKEDQARMRFIHEPSTHAFRIYSEMGGSSGWVQHCQGEIHAIPEALREADWKYPHIENGVPFLPDGEVFEKQRFYQIYRNCGFQYGPKFQCPVEIYGKHHEALALLKLPAESALPHDQVRIHPALLDCSFQVILAALPSIVSARHVEKVYLPARIERVRFYRAPGDELWCHVKVNHKGEQTLESVVTLFDSEGRIVAEIDRLTCQAVTNTATINPADDWLYHFDLLANPLETQKANPGDYLPDLSTIANHIEVNQEGDDQGKLYQTHEKAIDELCQKKSDDSWRALAEAFPAFYLELSLIRSECEGNRLSPFDPTLRDMLTRGWSMRRAHSMMSAFVQASLSELPRGRQVRILQVGANTGALTEWVSSVLPKELVTFVYTDPCEEKVAKAEERFSQETCFEFLQIDPKQSLIEQSLDRHSFDLVLVSHALLGSGCIPEVLANIREVIAPNGLLACNEFISPPQWWNFLFKQDLPVVPTEEWKSLLADAGFKESFAITTDDECQAIVVASQANVDLAESAAVKEMPVGKWLIFADHGGTGAQVGESLAGSGCDVEYIYQGEDIKSENLDEIENIVKQAGGLEAVLFFWGLDLVDPQAADLAALDSFENLFLAIVKVVRGIDQRTNNIPRLLLVTRGAHPDPQCENLSLAQAPLVGIGRNIINEHPSIHVKHIDLDIDPDSERETKRIVNELITNDEETEVLFRGEGRYTPRLTRRAIAPTRTERKSTDKLSYGLKVGQPGVLDSMTLSLRPSYKPRAGQIEIAVKSSALNFRDVLKALGIYPTDEEEAFFLGDECSGVVTRVGKGVTHLQPGDRITSSAPGSFGSFVTTRADFAIKIPDSMGFEDAATLPITFLTASYCLEHLGQIAEGERVLIHAATGGVGLAAIQIAQAAGAEIFATAGSPVKRNYLRGLGIEHVMDSRSIAFHDEILKITNGEGVDLVLNSLAGDAIPQSLDLLRDYGRFLEIGKRDIYENSRIGLRAFRKNISYHAVDLGKTMKDRVPLCCRLFEKLSERFHSGELRPLPQMVFSPEQIPQAFRSMREARHIGKVVVSFNQPNLPIEIPSEERDLPISNKASYLITGGTSGFGLYTAEWLVAQGAKALVLVSRSGASTDEAKRTIDRFKEDGVEVLMPRADVTSYEAVATVLDDIKQSSLPPLKGIVHAAMVLDDASLINHDAERIHRTFAPKAHGAWILHQLTEGLDLDFFTSYSSISSVIGSAGQGNYVAANYFLEALAWHRRATGKQGLAVNWGHIGEIGVASRSEETTDLLNRAGFTEMKPEIMVDLMGQMMQHDHAQMIVAGIDWPKFDQSSFFRTGKSPRFSRLLAEIDQSAEEQDDSRITEVILCAKPEEQFAILQNYLHQLLAKVLRTTTAKTKTNRPLQDLGLDSLMAVELINRMESDLHISVPTAQLPAKSIDDITEMLLPMISGTAAPQPTPSKVEPKPTVASAPERIGDFHEVLNIGGPLGNRVKASIGRAEDLPAPLLVEILQRRYALYANKDFITKGKQRQIRPVSALRTALAETVGSEIDETINLEDYRIDVDEHDFHPGCHHLVVTDDGGELMFYLRLMTEENSLSIPARKIYSEEIDDASGEGAAAEISRMIHLNTETLSAENLEYQKKFGEKIFDLVNRYALEQGIEHLYAQINPKHKAFYEAYGIFSQQGGEKPCPEVNDAPALLMHRRVQTISAIPV